MKPFAVRTEAYRVRRAVLLPTCTEPGGQESVVVVVVVTVRAEYALLRAFSVRHRATRLRAIFFTGLAFEDCRL